MKKSIHKISVSVLVAALRILRAATVILVAFLIYRLLLTRIRDDKGIIADLFVLWAFTAYLVLPRIHRKLTSLYLPDYFIGRARTGDGILGDPVNIAFLGGAQQLIKSMKKAGWAQAEELNTKSSIKMTKSTLLKHSYKNAPVSSLYLFGLKQDYAFQQQVDGNPKLRHHIRFWKVPAGWKLPGGFEADWLAAATYDRAVGFSLFTLQVTHKISEDIDEERDYVIKTLKKANPKIHVHVVQDYAVGYHSRNGGGDNIKTDGALPFVDLSAT